jgi:hypothetical protein
MTNPDNGYLIMEALIMKIMNRTSFRAALALMVVLLAAGFIWAGVPALAADEQGPVVSVVVQNANPIAENLNFDTFKNIAIRGHFSATDPDGDAVTFEIAGIPNKGFVQSESDGSFVYTPSENKKGQDSFSYIAIDNNGNMSNKATVTISISKQSQKLKYSDMTDNSSYYSALVLAERGVLIGEKLGNEYFFHPDGTVTRGEFVALCLGMTNAETLKGITRTGFSDDESIPMWVKPYISTALMSGIISGYKDDQGRLVFDSQDPITYAEAAVVLNNILKITDVVTVGALDQGTCAAWSVQAEANLAACHILPSMGTECSNNITRADAADMLVASINLLKDRDNGSLLNWAK